MSENFKVGEIAIAQYFDNFPEYNGQECEIMNSLEFRGIIENDMSVKENILRYRVKFPDGFICGPRPGQLRKKPKPDVKYGEAANESLYIPDLLAA